MAITLVNSAVGAGSASFYNIGESGVPAGMPVMRTMKRAYAG